MGTYNECVQCWDSPAPWDVIGHEKDCVWNDPDFMDCVSQDDALSDALFAMEGKSLKPASGNFAFSTFRKCSHAMDRIELEDGTPIYLSAHYDKTARHAVADLAFYLDRQWRPETIAYQVPWPDFGLPSLSDSQVLSLARTALAEARLGQVVEIGCLGAHGRTGTFASIVYLLSMSSPDASQAIRAIRERHCLSAVENDLQEWYVAHLARILRGEPAKGYRPHRVALKSARKPRKTARRRGARTKK